MGRGGFSQKEPLKQKNLNDDRRKKEIFQLDFQYLVLKPIKYRYQKTA